MINSCQVGLRVNEGLLGHVQQPTILKVFCSLKREYSLPFKQIFTILCISVEKIPTTDRTVSYGLLKIWVFVNKRFYFPRHLIAMSRN